MAVKTSKVVIFNYTMAGVLFGLLFPFLAIAFELINHGYALSLQSIYALHTHFTMLYMIDTAPLFLGSFAFVIGIKSYKVNKMNAVLQEQALTDELTSLHNRRYAKQKIDEYISGLNKGSKLGLFLIDFNKFKNVNDTLGHNTGDQLLEAVAHRLFCSFGSLDNLIRLGGDEFLILEYDMNQEADFIKARDRILGVFSTPFAVDKRELLIQVSIGVSIFPTDGTNFEALLKKADIAMYQCKFKNQSACELYRDYMAGEISNRFNIEYYLRDCIKNNELSIVYQPIINTKENIIEGVEALLRWNSPILGSIPPDVFIPITEQTGLIVDIGKWVLRESCIQAKSWHDQGIEFYISVNVSVEQLKDAAFENIVFHILDETGFDPKFLYIEITENISVSSIQNISSLLERLTSYGIKITYDDFGTGYSSFSQLLNLNIDTIKIDRLFISSLTTNVNHALITSAMIGLARNLNLQVIAEGVETKEQLAFLQRQGCCHVQGYLYSKPIPPQELEKLYMKFSKPQSE